MDSDLQILAIVFILAVLLINVLITGRRWRRVPVMRHLPAFEQLPGISAESIEANRPIHFSSGSAGIGDASTMLALVSNEVLYYTTRQVTMGDAAPLFTTSSTTALPLFMTTMRRAYTESKRNNVFTPTTHVRWYPAGVRSLAFAAGAATLQGEENVAGNVLAGSFGTEIVYMLDAAQRRNRPTIAVSDRLMGQAIAYAMTKEALIGEELFAAAGYLGDDSILRQRNIALDLMRWSLVFIMFIFVLLNVISEVQGG